MKKEEQKYILIGGGFIAIIILYLLYKKYKAAQLLNNPNPQPNNALNTSFGPTSQNPTGFPYSFYGPNIDLMNVAPGNNYNISVNGPSPYNFLTQKYMPLFGFVGVYGGRP